jgi:hypothetical protein
MTLGSSRRLAHWSVRALGLAAAALLVTGCNNTNNNGAGTSTTENFAGNLAAGGIASYPFTVTVTGAYGLTLVSLSPQTTITMGLGVGQPTATGCGLVTYTNVAKIGTALSGSLDPGSYCVSIYDLGNVTGTVDYSLSISHT